MLKLTSSALGLLMMMVVAPSAPAATHQNRSAQQHIDTKLHAQKLAPIKKSEILKTKIISTVSPTSAPKAPSLTEDERKQLNIRVNDENRQFRPHPLSERPENNLNEGGMAF